MLTDHQQQALDFKWHLAITANAGAGKTTVLVARFVEILLQTDVPVSRLVAITFTEKAAGELRRKIAEEVETRRRNASSPNEVRKLDHIRNDLITANIGTIHSFCGQLLREFPVEADVDAAFTVLEGVDQQQMQQDALTGAIDNVVQESSDPKLRDEFFDAIRMLGRRTVRSYLEAFLLNREKFDRLLSDEGGLSPNLSDDKILQRWNRAITDSIVMRLDDPRWKKSLSRILDLAAGKTAPEVSQLLAGFRPGLGLTEKISLYHEISELIFTKELSFRKNFVGKTDLSSYADAEYFVHFHKELKEIISSVLGSDGETANRVLLKIMRTLQHVLTMALQRYNERKIEYGQLDFDDLQLKAKALLRNTTIQERLLEKYSFIMVDEFQDTNRLQLELIQLLTKNFTVGNVFIVGDPKQSIYGFRDAEVKVFEEAKRLLSNGEKGEALVLAESFRLLPDLIDFVNRVFSRMMIESQFGVRYDELVQGRDTSADGAVELLIVPPSDEDENTNDDLIRQECRMIADRIAQLGREKVEVFHGREERSAPFEYRDAAILLRKRSHLQILEQVLVESKIPYVLSGGIGFYQTQEVYDFFNYFKFLLDPNDDIALVAILRSPFFIVTDSELFEISLQRGDSFWSKMQQYLQRGVATPLLQRAADILHRHQVLANRLPIPLLVQRIFLDTGWQGTVTGLPLGAQNRANVEKLVRIAREFEERGYVTLFDFVQRLKMLVDNEEREGQAAADLTGNCVQVMTIHSAKGLEFPIVIVPFAGEKFRYDTPPYVDPDIGVAFKVRSETDLDRKLVPSLYTFLDGRSGQRAEEEEKRIFYVACTRARDRLIISGRDVKRGGHSSYLRWMCDALKIDDVTSAQGRISLPAVSLKVLNRSVIREIQHSLSISLDLPRTHPVEVQQENGKRENPLPEISIFASPLRGEIRGEFFSATQIRTFLECPTKYYLKYILGMPEKHPIPIESVENWHENDKRSDANTTITPVAFDENEDGNDLLRGEMEGQLVHAVLQEIHDWNVPESEIVEQLQRAAISSGLYSSPELPVTLTAMARNIRRFLSSPAGHQIFSRNDAKTEFSISMLFDDDYLLGTIDRLDRLDNGTMRIIDYKTDRVRVGDIPSRADLYKPQLLFYAFLISKLFSVDQVACTVIFLSHPSSTINYEVRPDEIREFESTIHRVVHAIKAKQFQQFVGRCQNCTYRKGEGCMLPPVKS